MSEVFDLVILGGGCAGLSLSMALVAHGSRAPQTLVIESRTEFKNDRTWCFWSDRHKVLPYKIQHTWQTMRVSNGGHSVSLDCGATPYHMLAAEDFYNSAVACIDSQPNITLRMGTSVLNEPLFHGNLWNIDTSAGSISARNVVDTRPPKPVMSGASTLWQSFYGVEIECKKDIFEALSLDLMNFLEPDTRHVSFVYVLPVSPTRALIELTVFGSQPLEHKVLSEQLDTAVADRVNGSVYETLRSEHGILPMGLNSAMHSPHKSYVRVGVMAGSARPSTGYCFQRIQWWAHQCAASLAHHRQPAPHQPDPLALRFMDRIFLEVLKADPARGGSVFFALFSRASTARVIRFLSGNGSIVDSLAVIAAVPFSPFIHTAFQLLWRAGRIGKLAKTV